MLWRGWWSPAVPGVSLLGDSPALAESGYMFREAGDTLRLYCLTLDFTLMGSETEEK